MVRNFLTLTFYDGGVHMQGFLKAISRLLVVSMLVLPFQSIQAGMVSTDQVSVATSAQAQRAMVLSMVSRADVASQLQTMGIDSSTAQARVAAMTDSEVQTLANQIDSLPAGASSNSGWWIAGVIIIAILIWYAWK
jgi:hypothetical protein